MTGQPAQRSSDGPPSEYMHALVTSGFSLVPLGGGDDGKSPLFAYSRRERWPLRNILGPMHGRGSRCYGVRLEGLCVLDCDIYDPALIRGLEARFGASAVHVRTPRGCHLYYKAGAQSFPNLKGEGYNVDVKRGGNAYVAGPHSIRPDGGYYEPLKGDLATTKLTYLKTSEIALAPSNQPSAQMQEGGRHNALFARAIKLVTEVGSQDELAANLQYIRDTEFERPETMPDREVLGLAAWAWRKRLEGKIYSGRDSGMWLNRASLDAIKPYRNHCDAQHLYIAVLDQHGHRKGATFALKHEAMNSAGYVNLSRDRFRSAIETLMDCGLLQMAKDYSAGRHSRQYCLSRPVSETGGVQRMTPRRG